jgi:hypothetical protein
MLNDIFDDIAEEESIVSKIWNCLSLKVRIEYARLGRQNLMSL